MGFITRINQQQTQSFRTSQKNQVSQDKVEAVFLSKIWAGLRSTRLLVIDDVRIANSRNVKFYHLETKLEPIQARPDFYHFIMVKLNL